MRKQGLLQKSDHQERTGRLRLVLPRAPLPVLRIEKLLNSRRLEVKRISSEIQLHSSLQSLVLHMATALAFSPASCVRSIDEAVAMMGPDRLRVVLYMWSLLRQKGSEPTAFRAIMQSGPEALYLASFLRYLGLDSRDAAVLHSEMFSFALDPARTEFTELREMLMRDFLALLSVLNPSLLRRTPANGADL